MKIQIIFRKKLHAFDFADDDIVVGWGVCGRTDVKVVRFGDIVFPVENESSDAQLKQSEVVGGFLDSFVELEVVGEETFNFIEFGDKA